MNVAQGKGEVREFSVKWQ